MARRKSNLLPTPLGQWIWYIKAIQLKSATFAIYMWLLWLMEYDLSFHATMKLCVYSWLFQCFAIWTNGWVQFAALLPITVQTKVWFCPPCFIYLFHFVSELCTGLRWWLHGFQLINQRNSTWANTIIQWCHCLCSHEKKKAVICVLPLCQTRLPTGIY